jgi:hypothetical protein
MGVHPPGLWDLSNRHSVTGDILLFYNGFIPVARDPRIPDVPVSRIGGQSLFLYRERDSSLVLIDAESNYYDSEGKLPGGRISSGMAWSGFDTSGEFVCYRVNKQAFLYDIRNDNRISLSGYNSVTPTIGKPFFLAYNWSDSTYTLLDSTLAVLSKMKGPEASRLKECFLLDADYVVVTIQRVGRRSGQTCVRLSFDTQTTQELYSFDWGQVLSASFLNSTDSSTSGEPTIH